MSNLKKFNPNLNSSVEVKSLKNIQEKTGNLYESLYVITRRANQINQQIREELHHKLEEFASHNDNLEEVFENREQIEISKHYEKLPKPTLVALEEFMTDGIYIRRGDEENTEA